MTRLAEASDASTSSPRAPTAEALATTGERSFLLVCLYGELVIVGEQETTGKS
jgi:hypothetical protein